VETFQGRERVHAVDLLSLPQAEDLPEVVDPVLPPGMRVSGRASGVKADGLAWLPRSYSRIPDRLVAD
jgi:hypothetical protein